MNFFKVLFISILFVGMENLFAQEYNFDPNYESDILRFSSHNFGGTARFMSVGGAFGSVGADMSNFSHNPAGVGMYRNTVGQFSFGTRYSKYNTSYMAETSKDVKVSASIPSVGIVFGNSKASKNGLFRSTAFGIVMNRLGEFNYSEKVSAFNTNPGSSISWNWANEMSDVYNGAFTNETSVNQVSFNTYTGFYGYLANFDSAILDYTSPVVDSFQQTRFTDVRGGKNEIAISGGANFLDKLYFGATVGIPILNYRRESRFIEEDESNNVATNTFFNSFELREDYRTEGIGFNLKIGAIYRPNKWLRLAAAAHSPERISMTERYSSVLDSDLDFGNYTISSGEGVFEYRMRMPWRTILGASIFFKESGFISVDYEAVGFNSMRYTFENNFREISDAYNQNLKTKYQVGHNVRVGAEAVYKTLRIRAGYNYSGSPLKKEFRVEGFDFSRHTFSSGFGLMFERVAVDFAYQHNLSKQFEQPYLVRDATVAGINKRVNQGFGVVTLSYKLK